jgi:ketosteroid isomerase-like protein
MVAEWLPVGERAMSQESATAPGRDALDRLLVRFPRLLEWMGAALGRMRSGSALRQRLLSLSVRRAFDAMARSDLELVLQRYDSNVEVWMRGMSGVGGPDGCYRGHEGVRTIYAEVDEVFEEWRWTIRSVVDGGDRLAIRADFFGVGRGSGVETTLKDAGTAARLSARGTATWQEWIVEENGWPKALEAAGRAE